MKPPMFTATNSSVSQAKSTTAFNNVMGHFCLIDPTQRKHEIDQR